MKIAQIAPLSESVPPQLYGGTERVVSYLTEELVRFGHEVTLFASGDSKTSARLRAICPRALRLAKVGDPLAHNVKLLEVVFREAGEFDILHFHLDYLHYSLGIRQNTPFLTTLHGRLDLPDLPSVFAQFPSLNLVSISDAQRKPLGYEHWSATIYHGLPKALYTPTFERGKYLAFAGRICLEKRLDRAIEIARLAKWPLRIAAKVDPVDQDYFEESIRPLLSEPGVEFLGEIPEQEKSAFFGGAAALLFPIDWPEPFGLVQIEALACGTPVIAFRGGSVPEVLDDGHNGYIVNSIPEAIDAVARIERIERRACRASFERRFTAERMARDYEKLYRRLLPDQLDQEQTVRLQAAA